MKKQYFYLVTIILIVSLFSYTAVSKFLEREKFIFQMRLAPIPWMHVLAPVLSWAVPALEAAVVIGLLTVRFRQKALNAALILFCVFELYILGMLMSGHHLPCTCGGVISKMSWKAHLLFNAVFIVITSVAIYWHRKYRASSISFADRQHDLSRA